MQILITEIERLRKELNNIVGELSKAGYKKAKAEYTYRIALAKELLILRDRGLPATLTNDVARGNEEIAKLKFNRDYAETIYDATLEKLRAIKIELGIVERQMEATRRGE